MEKAPPAAASKKAALNKDAVYNVTTKGKAELGAAGTHLSASEVKLLVLIDGQATVSQLLKQAAASLAPAAAVEALDKLERDGLISTKVANDGIEATGFFMRPVLPMPSATAENKSQADFTLELLRRQGYVARIVKRAAEARTVAAGEKMVVLVVEDDPQLVKLLRMFLQLEGGYELRFAGNREEITAALRLGKPDLVLLDVTLPDADGFDVLIRMRQHPVLKEIPVIMMTAKASREAVLKGLVAGANGYITKPFNIEVIVQAVKSVLGLAA